MVQYRQFAQVFMVWMGRWSFEFDIIDFETWTCHFFFFCHFLIRLFYSNQVLAGGSWK